MASARGTVAMLHYAGPPYVGGVELTMAAHARILVERGYSVRILAANAEPLGRGIELVRHAEFGSRGEEIEAVNAELAGGKISPRFDALVERTTELLDRTLAGATVLIVHNVLSLHKNLALTAALARWHAAGARPRVLAWCHDFAWADPQYATDMHDGPPWDLLRTPWPEVQYVVVSRDRQRTLSTLFGVAAGDIWIVPPGIDVARFLKLAPATEALVGRLDLLAADPLLLTPARITRRKNIELAVEVTAALRDHDMNPRLVVTGPPGPHNPTNMAYLHSLRDLCRVRRADDLVVFLHDEWTAAVTDEMVADLFRLADALLLPSRSEGFGIPLLEAGLAGIPIFASDLPVFREVFPAIDVTFSLNDAPTAVAGRIAAALRVDARYRRRRRVRTEYSWTAVGERVLLPAIEGRPPTPGE